ncbi:MAG: hypothetical protein FWC60_02180, partial [Firmicutes bacterium]|nr:hypothetical protein [Bacillota bacterium]
MKKLWNAKYRAAGLTAFLVIVCSIFFYLLITHWSAIWGGVSWFVGILSPIFWGLTIGYLLNPIVRFFQRHLFDPLGRKLFQKHPARAFSFGRGISVLVTVLLALAAIVALLWLILPQLYTSIVNIVITLPKWVDTATVWINDTLSHFKR